MTYDEINNLSLPQLMDEADVIWSTLNFHLTLILKLQDNGVGFSACNIITDGEWSYEFVLYDPVGGPLADTYRANGDTLEIAMLRAYAMWKYKARP